jgi:NAD(P)H-hydrate epimerase
LEILTGSEMRRVDRRAIDGLGIPSLDLMEAAGNGIAEAMRRDDPDLARRTIAVVCGRGNNGGDGLVIARRLSARGMSPRVVLLARGADLEGDPAVNLRLAHGTGVEIVEAPDDAAWGRAFEWIAGCDLVVDALLGTGVRGGARGLVARAIEDLVASRADIVSVDLPSGVDADSGEVDGAAIRARRTYTLCRPKVPLVIDPAARYAGSWRVIDIGIPDECVVPERSTLEWLDADAAPALPRRPRHAHKGDYGHLLVVAGSRGKSGAAVLASRAALRAGVGLVTAATPRSCLPVVAGQQAEVMTEPLPETTGGALALGAATRVRALLSSRDALALGPGLGTEAATGRAVAEIVAERTAPVVIDADGLNAFAARGAGKTTLRAGKIPLVLTPHPGEAARLLGTSPGEVQRDRIGAARALASLTGAVVVLKGHRTLVAEPSGAVRVNGSGNPGMATAGTGDVLTGIVGAFLARGLPALEAARLAAFVHGDAGDRAAASRGEEGLIAGDLIEALPAAVAARVAPELGA